MGYEAITRTAPGWEERTVTLLPAGVRAVDGAGPAVSLRPGFARVAALLEVTAFGGGSGLSVYLQHSPDGARWFDAAAFHTVEASGPQVLWIEAQPELAGDAEPLTDGEMAEGTVHGGFLLPRLRARWRVGGAVAHAFGVDVVAVYAR